MVVSQLLMLLLSRHTHLLGGQNMKERNICTQKKKKNVVTKRPAFDFAKTKITNIQNYVQKTLQKNLYTN